MTTCLRANAQAGPHDRCTSRFIWGGVGAGREKPPATRLAYHIVFLADLTL